MERKEDLASRIKVDLEKSLNHSNGELEANVELETAPVIEIKNPNIEEKETKLILENKLNSLLYKFIKPKEEKVEVIPNKEILNIPVVNILSEQKIYIYENAKTNGSHALKPRNEPEIKVWKSLEKELSSLKNVVSEEKKGVCSIFYNIDELNENYSDPDELQNQFDASDYEYEEE